MKTNLKILNKYLPADYKNTWKRLIDHNELGFISEMQS